MGLISAFRALRRPSLHARVVAAVVLLCVVLVGLDGWRSWQDRQRELAEDQVVTANLARSLGQHAHDTLQAADTAVVGLRDAVETDGLTPKALKHLNRLMTTQVAALPVLHGLFVFDASGAYVADSLSPTPAPLNGSDRDYFKYHRSHSDRGVHIGKPVRSKADGSWIITASRRLDAPDGSFAGVAVATISIDFLQKFYATFDVGPGGVISLDTSDGLLVARKPADETPVGTDVSRGQLYAQLRSPAASGSFQYVSVLDGVRRLGSYQRVEGFPLVVIVGHALREALADWRSDSVFHLLVSVAAAALVAGLGTRLAAQLRKRQDAAAAVRRSEQHYRLLADNSTDLITQLGPDFQRLYVSPASEALLGYDPRELVGRQASDLLDAEDQAVFAESLNIAAREGFAPPATYRIRRKDGSTVWVETTGRRMEDGCGFVLASRDVTQRKKAEELLHEANDKLQRLVMLDGLTGIANRRGFDIALEKEHRRAVRTGTALALLMIDVDAFKAFNDAQGHSAGDACLQAVAGCVQRTMLRPADLAARYGGEEFAVLLPDTDHHGAMTMAERIREAVRELGLARGGDAGLVTVSIGVAAIRPRRDGLAAQDLVSAADTALYQAKATGRDRVCCAPGQADPSAVPEAPPLLTS